MKLILVHSIIIKSIISFPNSHNIWFWLAIVVLIIIIFVGYKLLNKKKNLTFSDLTIDNVKELKNADIDMNNLVHSINRSRDLYKKLSSLCHPDRFANTSKEKIAEVIFQEISKNKRNFEELSHLKVRAREELDIDI